MPGASLLGDLAAALDRSLPVPLSLQLKGLIEYGIVCGELPPGTRLPSVRDIAEAGGIAPMTAVGVYKELQQSGLIVARQGAGTFVADGPPTRGAAALGRVQVHLDAALAEAEAAGIAAGEVASLLSARIGRSRAREGRAVRIVMLGVFEDATLAYAQEIARQLKPGDAIEPLTFTALRLPGAHVPAADLYVTLANRTAEAEALLGPARAVTSVSFIPSETTRGQLAGVDPLARMGLVSVFPEFLALMKPGVLRFAPHVTRVEAVLLEDPALPEFLAALDVIVYATGAERALAFASPVQRSIEYRHIPDPHAVQASLLPLVEAVRSGAPMPVAAKEEAL